jgi:hypothetical protein
MTLRYILGCEDGRWIKLDEDRIAWGHTQRKYKAYVYFAFKTAQAGQLPVIVY